MRHSPRLYRGSGTFNASLDTPEAGAVGLIIRLAGNSSVLVFTFYFILFIYVFIYFTFVVEDEHWHPLDYPATQNDSLSRT